MPETTAAPAAAAPVVADQLGIEILRSIASNPTRDDWLAYEQAKRDFTARHPWASSGQYEAFVASLAKALNL